MMLVCRAALAIALMGLVGPAFAEDRPAPQRFEIAINGENFTVPLGQAVTLASADKPGTVYKLALRVAQYQPLKLNTLSLDYHVGFAVDDDRKASSRTATLKHELGFVVSITDVGGPLTREQQEKLLDVLVESAKRSLGEGAEGATRAAAPSERKLGQATVRGVTVQAKDGEGRAQCAMAYVIAGKELAATCVVRCAWADRTNVISLIKPTLESFAPLPKKR